MVPCEEVPAPAAGVAVTPVMPATDPDFDAVAPEDPAGEFTGLRMPASRGDRLAVSDKFVEMAGPSGKE